MFHGAHQTFFNESEIKITDRILNYYREYSNITIYAINYYSNIIFPSEKGIKKIYIRIVQNIINTKLYNKKILQFFIILDLIAGL